MIVISVSSFGLLNSCFAGTASNAILNGNHITFTVPEDATGNITVVVANETYTVPVSGGTGTLTIPKLPAGNYTINASFAGNDTYLGSSVTNNITVNAPRNEEPKQEPVLDLSSYEQEQQNYDKQNLDYEIEELERQHAYSLTENAFTLNQVGGMLKVANPSKRIEEMLVLAGTDKLIPIEKGVKLI